MTTHILDGIDTDYLRSNRDLDERFLAAWDEDLHRLYALAVHREYDFIDVHVTGYGRVGVVMWNEPHEPQYAPIDAPTQRSDLRDVSYADIRWAAEELMDVSDD